MEHKQKLVLFLTGLFLILLFGGLSVAFFTGINNNESTSTIYAKGGSMMITYTNGSGNIDIQNIYPKETAWATKKFTVTGNNSTDLDMQYRLLLYVDNNTFSYPLTYSLTGTNTSSNGTILENQNNVNIKTKGYQILGNGKFKKGSNSIHTYNLKIYYKNQNVDQNIDQTASFQAMVKIDDGLQELPTILATKITGNNLENVSEPKVQIGAESTELNTLASAPENKGTTYYYRGIIEGNFLVFANMCWRVVRIDENDNIKVALYNYSSADCTQTGDTLAFARYDGTNYLTYFNNNNGINSNKFVGYTYSATVDSSQVIPSVNDTQSDILKNLTKWYNRVFTIKEKSYLADVTWCNERSLSSFLNKTGAGTGTNDTYYIGMERQVQNTYSFDCSEISRYTYNITKIKAGLLTADELIYSGFTYRVQPQKTVFINENTGEGYWTLTPGDNKTMYNGMSSGGITLSNKAALRPAIAFKSEVEYSGTGTPTDPYVIK